MQNFFLLRVFLFTVAILSPAFGQFSNVEIFVLAGQGDAELLSRAYLQPFANGFGADLNSGWFRSARTHKFLGFDFAVMASTAVAPSADGTFDLSALQLSHVRLSNSSTDPNTPTVIGPGDSGPGIEVYWENPRTGRSEVVETFTMPPGIDFRYVPSLMVQGSLGLFFNTDVILRFFPESEIHEDLGELGILGIGLKHDLMQWIPGAEAAPFDLAIFAGWTSLTARTGLDLFLDPLEDQPNIDFSNQKVELETNTYAMSLILSKKMSLVTLFGSVGFEKATHHLELKGEYAVSSIEIRPTSPRFGERITTVISNPVDVSLNGVNSLRASLGLQVSLLFLNIHGIYTFADYPVANAGVTFSVR